MLADPRQADELPAINMTPMVDVVLCLLIFFLAATRLYDWDENQFEVAVPQVDRAGPLTSAPEDIDVLVRAPGRAAIDDREFDLPALTLHLKAARERYPNQGVLVRADANLAYQDLADVLSACNEAGIRNVVLPVRPRADPPR